MRAITNDPVGTLADVVPGLLENSDIVPMGKQIHVMGQVYKQTLADDETYNIPLFVAPCDNVYLKQLYAVAQTADTAGTTGTVDVYKYDGSTDTSVATQLNTTTMSDKTPEKLALTTTRANRLLDKDDYLWVKWVQGDITTSGAVAEEVSVHAILIVPEVDAD